jgi:DnaK suppressor protein
MIVSCEDDLKVMDLPEGYSPFEDAGEFMNPVMREFFRQKLLDWRKELAQEYNRGLLEIQTENLNEADPNDRASNEIDLRMKMRSMDRERKLINKIDEALQRIRTNTFGYCEQTGEPIEIGRLIARPVATLSFVAQEALERIEKVHRE